MNPNSFNHWPKQPRFARPKQGFALLEAIVSLVLISTTGLAVYSLLNVNLIALQRIKDSARENEAMDLGLSIIKQINPLEQPQGQRIYDKFTLSWNSEPLRPTKDNIGYPSGRGLYQVGLFKINASITIANNKTNFSVVQIGYKQIRAVDLGI